MESTGAIVDPLIRDIVLCDDIFPFSAGITYRLPPKGISQRLRGQEGFFLTKRLSFLPLSYYYHPLRIGLL